MRSIATGFITAVVTFTYSIVAMMCWTLYNLPSVELVINDYAYPVSSIDWEALEPVAPPLHPSLQGLSDRERDGLRGPVKTVRVGSGYIEERGKRSRNECEYDLEGKTTYSQDGDKIDEFFRYRCGHRDPYKEFYDDRGRLVQRLIFKDGMILVWRNMYLYDSDGRLIDILCFNEDGILHGRTTYSYQLDSYGNWVRQTSSSGYIECRAIEYYDKR